MVLLPVWLLLPVAVVAMTSRRHWQLPLGSASRHTVETPVLNTKGGADVASATVTVTLTSPLAPSARWNFAVAVVVFVTLRLVAVTTAGVNVNVIPDANPVPVTVTLNVVPETELIAMPVRVGVAANIVTGAQSINPRKASPEMGRKWICEWDTWNLL